MATGSTQEDRRNTCLNGVLTVINIGLSNFWKRRETVRRKENEMTPDYVIGKGMTAWKPAKVYVGKRYGGQGCRVYVREVYSDEVDSYVNLKTDRVVSQYEIKLRLDLRDHSPTGLEWGYRGSGPSQTALAILSDHFDDDERATALYQVFKEEVIQHLPVKDYLFTDGGNEQWRISGAMIDEALDNWRTKTLQEWPS